MDFWKYKITSEYGDRNNPTGEGTEFHSGIDYATPLNTKIKSNISGTVVTSTYNNGYGNYVVIRDNNGKMHYYAHLNKRSVNVGDDISKGELLGYSGSTGRSTGPHLHYEVRNNNVSVNPSEFINNHTGTLRETLENKTLLESADNTGTIFDVAKDKYLSVIGNVFKYLIIILLVVLIVFSVVKALDIEIL